MGVVTEAAAEDCGSIENLPVCHVFCTDVYWRCGGGVSESRRARDSVFGMAIREPVVKQALNFLNNAGVKSQTWEVKENLLKI